MQSVMQRNVAHTCAMCSSRCATAHLVTPPVPSAHVQYTPLRQPLLRFSAASFFSSRHSHRQDRLPSAIQMSATSDYGAKWGEAPESFIVLGLAHCFEKDDNGKLADRFVIEPISANSLECMATGAKTCFKEVKSVTLSEALSRDRAVLPEEWASATFCDEYDFRCGACARTWSRPHAQDNLMDIVPLGRTKSNFNYNLDEKRVLNFENIVNDDDNIKQDISIDVYGRAEKEESAEETAPADKQEEEEELDSLLAA